MKLTEDILNQELDKAIKFQRNYAFSNQMIVELIDLSKDEQGNIDVAELSNLFLYFSLHYSEELIRDVFLRLIQTNRF